MRDHSDEDQLHRTSDPNILYGDPPLEGIAVTIPGILYAKQVAGSCKSAQTFYSPQCVELDFIHLGRIAKRFG